MLKRTFMCGLALLGCTTLNACIKETTLQDEFEQKRFVFYEGILTNNCAMVQKLLEDTHPLVAQALANDDYCHSFIHEILMRDIYRDPLKYAQLRKEERYVPWFRTIKPFFVTKFGKGWQDFSETNPLSLAIFLNNRQMIGILLAFKADINKIPGVFELYAPLHIAVKHNPAIIHFLLERGADKELKAYHGTLTPLMVACAQDGNVESAHILLDAGVSASYISIYFNELTASELASLNQENKIIELPDLGKNANQVNWPIFERTELAGTSQFYKNVIMAIFNGDIKNFMKMLENAPYDGLNEVNKYGLTPLMWATIRGNEQAVDALLDLAQPKKESCLSSCLRAFMLAGLPEPLHLQLHDKNGRTAYDWAMYLGHHAIAEKLQKFIQDSNESFIVHN